MPPTAGPFAEVELVRDWLEDAGAGLLVLAGEAGDGWKGLAERLAALPAFASPVTLETPDDWTWLHESLQQPTTRLIAVACNAEAIPEWLARIPHQRLEVPPELLANPSPLPVLADLRQAWETWLAEGDATVRQTRVEEVALAQWKTNLDPADAADLPFCPFLWKDRSGKCGFLHRGMWEYVVAQRLAREVGTPALRTTLQAEYLTDGILGYLAELAGPMRLWQAAVALLMEHYPNQCEFGEDKAGWGLWRIRNKVLRGERLQGVNLSGLDLSGFDFSDCDLSGASLKGANLVGARFAGATLADTDLTGAFVCGAAFHGSTGMPAGEPADTSLSDILSRPGLSARPWLAGVGGELPYGEVVALAWSPDGKRLAIGGHPGWLLQYEDDKAPLPFRCHPAPIVALSYLGAEGNELASSCAGVDGVRIWDTATGALLRTGTIPLRPREATLELVPAWLPKAMKKFDASLHSPQGGISPDKYALVFGQVTTAAVSPDGKDVAVGGTFGSVQLWDTATRQIAGHVSIGSPGNLRCYVNALVYNPVSGVLAIGGVGMVVLVEPSTRQIIGALYGFHGGFSPAGCVYSSDGQRLLTANASGACSWDTRTGERTRLWPGKYCGVAISPDGSRIALSGHENVEILDGGSGEVFHQLTGAAFDALAFSRDSTRLLTSNYGRTKLWDAHTGRLLREWDAVAACFGNGPLLAIGKQQGPITVMDSTKGRVRWNLPGWGQPSRLAYSADGTRLAVSCSDFVTRILDAATGECLLTLGSPAKNPHLSIRHEALLAFSPDGKQLAATSADCAVRLWDTSSGTLLHTLEGHEAVIKEVNFSPDGRQLASCSEDATVRIWDPAAGRQLCVLYPRYGVAAVLDEQGRVEAFAGTPEGPWIFGWQLYEPAVWAHLRYDEAVARRLSGLAPPTGA